MYSKSYNDAFFVTLVSIALITLNPFHLDAPQYDDFWEWLIYPPDVAQNILLFIPVGAAIQSVTRPSLLFTMLTGFAFSLTIESLQLYIPERHSNFIDLITNTIGAGVGSILFLVMTKTRKREAVTLSFMLVPLCWVISMRSATQDAHAWMSLMIAGALFLAVRPKSPYHLCVTLIILGVAFIPFISILDTNGIILTLLASGGTLALYKSQSPISSFESWHFLLVLSILTIMFNDLPALFGANTRFYPATHLKYLEPLMAIFCTYIFHRHKDDIAYNV